MTTQLGLFGEDREVKPRRLTKQQQHWRDQPFLIPQGQIAQFGVTARPLLPLSDKTALALIMEDPRTEEQKDQDRERAAQALTKSILKG